MDILPGVSNELTLKDLRIWDIDRIKTELSQLTKPEISLGEFCLDIVINSPFRMGSLFSLSPEDEKELWAEYYKAYDKFKELCIDCVIENTWDDDAKTIREFDEKPFLGPYGDYVMTVASLRAWFAKEYSQPPRKRRKPLDAETQKIIKAIETGKVRSELCKELDNLGVKPLESWTTGKFPWPSSYCKAWLAKDRKGSYTFRRKITNRISKIRQKYVTK